MDLHKMIIELQGERQRLDEAIQALERLAMNTARRRNRSSAWPKNNVEHQAPSSEKSASDNLGNAKKAGA